MTECHHVRKLLVNMDTLRMSSCTGPVLVTYTKHTDSYIGYTDIYWVEARAGLHTGAGKQLATGMPD